MKYIGIEPVIMILLKFHKCVLNLIRKLPNVK